MPDDDDVVGAVDAITGEKSVGRRLVREQPWRALALRCCANDDALCRCRAADEVAVTAVVLRSSVVLYGNNVPSTVKPRQDDPHVADIPA